MTIVPCPGCKRDMTPHCNGRCQWMACLNRQCEVRYADMRNGHTTKKTRAQDAQ